jgi:hypothetical protein
MDYGERPVEERIVYLTSPNSYGKLFRDRDVRFQIQWDLERLLAERTDGSSSGWNEVNADDLRQLGGNVADAGPKLHELISAIATRKGNKMVSKGITPQLSALFTEVDREEASLRGDGPSGMGSADPDWPYGGKVVYSLLLRPLSSTSPAQSGVGFS